MSIAITKKIDSMASKVRPGFLLIAVLSSIIVLSACSTKPERSSTAISIPVSEGASVASEEGNNESNVEPELKVKASTISSPKSKLVAKPAVENKAPKPSVSKQTVKKVDKKIAVSKKPKVQKKKAVSKKPKVQKEKVVSRKPKVQKKKAVSKKLDLQKKKIEKEIIVEPLVESTSAVVQTGVIQKSTGYKVELDKMPILIGNNWTLSRDANMNGQCALSYRKVVMGDGQGETPVMVIISQDEALFKTKSNIDVSYEQTGVTIDDQPQLPIEKLHNDFSISYKAQYQTLVERMKKGEQAVLTLGFWPSWPVTHTYSISLDLGEFATAQQALLVCLELEKELK